jgi:hypothetical protein
MHHIIVWIDSTKANTPLMHGFSFVLKIPSALEILQLKCTYFCDSTTHVPGCVCFTLELSLFQIYGITHFLQLRFTKGECQLKMFTINVDFSFSFQARNHTDFLCRMKEYIPSRSVFTDGVIAALGEHFSVQPMDLQAVPSGDEEFVPSTKLLSQQDLEEIVSSKESPRVQKVEA